ncbi:membrane dipeptidase [Pedobacter sp. HMF7647]|uniref:Membrane dipeptidase n=1 Tax=Hufsiella arboris TaxID=2695275 RepID=A0A7K1Y6P8_9SPHI|nr:dipeptidase [Hufsiella arboris]MXV50243.1 membrane dipeptidase [Hufsiella arboris]
MKIKIKLIAALLFLFSISAQAQKNKLKVIDTHNDVISNQLTSGKDLAKNEGEQFDLVKAGKGKLTGQVFSIWSDETGNFKYANREIDSLYALINRNPSKIKLARNSSEVESIISDKKMAALIGVEGGHMIDDNLDFIDSLQKRGMCYLTLTWNNSTSWATSAADEVNKKDLPHKGLSDFGKQVITRLNILGVMVDISHVGEQTFYDAISASTKPVIASHSSVFKLCPHQRNLKDDQLKAIAAKGGVVFVNFYSGFIDSTYNRKLQAFFKEHQAERDSLSKLYPQSQAEGVLLKKHPAEYENMRPPLSLLVDHIDYIAKLIGVDHVGIGADFEGAESYPKELDDVSDYPKIFKELRKRGYSKSDIKKIANQNFLRVLKANTGS